MKKLKKLFSHVCKLKVIKGQKTFSCIKSIKDCSEVHCSMPPCNELGTNAWLISSALFGVNAK